jgi:predicted amino acid dehydrogenase
VSAAKAKPPVTFGFLVHPMDIEDVARKYAMAEKAPPRVVAEFIRHLMPFVECRMTGVRSKATGEEVTGVLGVVPFLPEHFGELKDEALVDKIVLACKACARKGAKIVGLGAMNAMPGRGGRAVAAEMRVAITTGNSYTVAAAIRATRAGAAELGIDTKDATLAVLGASGPVGRAASILLGGDYGRVLLAGRDRSKLSATRDEVKGSLPADLEVRTDIISALGESRVIVVASPEAARLVRAEDLMPGSLVCEITRPRELARAALAGRADILVIDGGLVRVPGGFDLGLDLGLPRGFALACMAETMILALERRYEDYTLGREVSVERVLEIDELAEKHGFEVEGFRRGEGALEPAEVQRVKALAGAGLPGG